MMITLWIWYFCVFFSSILMCYSVMILIRIFFLSPNVASDNTLNSFIAVQNNENSALAPKSSLVHRHFVSVCVCVCINEGKKPVSFYQQRKWKHDLRIFIPQCSELFTFWLRFFLLSFAGYAIAITTAHRNSQHNEPMDILSLTHYRLLPRSKYFSLFSLASIVPLHNMQLLATDLSQCAFSCVCILFLFFVVVLHRITVHPHQCKVFDPVSLWNILRCKIILLCFGNMHRNRFFFDTFFLTFAAKLILLLHEIAK